MATEFERKDYAHLEGPVAKTIEDQTAKLPSDAFLWMAVGSMAVSATLQMMGKGTSASSSDRGHRRS